MGYAPRAQDERWDMRPSPKTGAVGGVRATGQALGYASGPQDKCWERRPRHKTRAGISVRSGAQDKPWRVRVSGPPRPGSAGLAEWSNAWFRLRIGKASGSNPGVAISAQIPARVNGEQSEVDCGKFPVKLAATDVFEAA